MQTPNLIDRIFVDIRAGSDRWTVVDQRRGVCELRSDRRNALRCQRTGKVLDQRIYREVTGGRER